MVLKFCRGRCGAILGYSMKMITWQQSLRHIGGVCQISSLYKLSKPLKSHFIFHGEQRCHQGAPFSLKSQFLHWSITRDWWWYSPLLRWPRWTCENQYNKIKAMTFPVATRWRCPYFRQWAHQSVQGGSDIMPVKSGTDQTGFHWVILICFFMAWHQSSPCCWGHTLLRKVTVFTVTQDQLLKAFLEKFEAADVTHHYTVPQSVKHDISCSH